MFFPFDSNSIYGTCRKHSSVSATGQPFNTPEEALVDQSNDQQEANVCKLLAASVFEWCENVGPEEAVLTVHVKTGHVSVYPEQDFLAAGTAVIKEIKYFTHN